jgi:hypothetical protein
MNRKLLVGLAAVALFASPAVANEFDAQLTKIGRTQIAKFVEVPEVIEAIKAQNAVTGSYDQAKIDALDK